MRVRIARTQPRRGEVPRTCDHHEGLSLEAGHAFGTAPACTGPVRAIVLDFLPDVGLTACPEAIEYLSQPS